ncbi:MAG: VWA domain-containing protein [Pseudomonadota bacterium]
MTDERKSSPNDRDAPDPRPEANAGASDGPSLRFSLHRYSRWDGSQREPLDANQVLGNMADDLLEYGDLRWALRNLMSRGLTSADGSRLDGLRQLKRRLEARREQQLKRFNLDSIFEDFRERLAAIEAQEQACIDQWLSDTPPTAAEGEDAAAPDFSNAVLKQIAERNRETLSKLPDGLPGRIRELEHYEFLDPDAQRKFLELLNELRQGMANTFFKDLKNTLDTMSDDDLARMKAMLNALNDMLSAKIGGDDPDFDGFMEEFGDLFGDNPPQSLDALLEQMAQQMAAAQSLLDSLSPADRAALAELLDDRLADPELAQALRELTKELNFLNETGGFDFRGDESLNLDQAMDLMDELTRTDEAIEQLKRAERQGNLDRLDRDLLKDLLGDDADDALNTLDELRKTLEDAGYLRQDERGQWELTARGSRRIGQHALGEIYQRLKRQSLGSHAIPEEGRFGERLEDTKPYEFGDPFHLHMPRTLRNALHRTGPRTPVQLEPNDFEIYRSERVTSTATAMLVDLSWSMALRGSFQAAKKVALALHNLITSQYPKDSFYIIGFAAYARELKPSELPFLQWDEYVLGTNMQHALLLAEKLLAKHRHGSKQIIMISDGEPTAHLEGGEAQFAYPPTPSTIRATFRAVKHCTTRGIDINTFMLEESPYLRAFMDEIARINGGRVFYTSPEQLGEYILVDYVQHKRKRLAGRR